MNDIRAIFTLQRLHIDWRGTPIDIRRPSALDIIEALEVSKSQPERLYAWFAFRHVEHAGKPVFSSLEDALAADGHAIVELGKEVERLYGEGRD
jgi:hypothetical protein